MSSYSPLPAFSVERENKKGLQVLMINSIQMRGRHSPWLITNHYPQGFTFIRDTLVIKKKIKMKSHKGNILITLPSLWSHFLFSIYRLLILPPFENSNRHNGHGRSPNRSHSDTDSALDVNGLASVKRFCVTNTNAGHLSTRVLVRLCSPVGLLGCHSLFSHYEQFTSDR